MYFGKVYDMTSGAMAVNVVGILYHNHSFSQLYKIFHNTFPFHV